MNVEALRLVAISSRVLCRGTLEDAAAELLEGGATAIMLREKDLAARDLLAVARRVRGVCAARCALFLVNHSLEVALACDADGAHLGAASLPPEAARRIAPKPFVLGFSAHDEDEIRRAEKAGCDYCTISPVFQPTSKEYTSPPLGLEGLRACARSTRMPLVALGGIVAENAADCIAEGAVGVAAIGALFGAESRYHAARGFAAAIGPRA